MDGRHYTEAQFRQDYHKLWRDTAEVKDSKDSKDLWEEFLDLRFAYLGY